MLKRLCTLVLLILTLLPALSAIAGQEGKLLLLGDSLGASYGVPMAQGWARQLQQRLTQEGHSIDVVNASISGDTTAAGLARLEDLLQREQPRWILLELGGNDGLRGLNLSAMKSNLQSMIDLSRKYHATPALIGIKIPPNYGRKYRDRFEQVYVDLSRENGIALLPFLLDGIGGVDGLMQEDRIHPNAKAQSIVSDNVWRFLQPLLNGSTASVQ